MERLTLENQEDRGLSQFIQNMARWAVPPFPTLARVGSGWPKIERRVRTWPGAHDFLTHVSLGCGAEQHGPDLPVEGGSTEPTAGKRS